MIFPRHLLRTDEAAFRNEPELERWTVESGEGPVDVFFLPAAQVPAPAVIFCHGNGELIDYWVRPLRRYRELGVSVILPEYRGYGRSAGRPSEHAIVQDVREVHERARADSRITSLMGHGRSLGGGAVCGLAKRSTLDGLIMESTFTSIPDLVSWAPRRLLSDVFDNHSVLRDVDVPVLFLHGRRDQIVPFAHARRNVEVTRDAQLVAFECGHNDMPQNARYWSAVESLLERVATREPNA